MNAESGPAQWTGGMLTEHEQNQIREELEQLRKNSQFFDEHLVKWRKQYPDMYVAVYREQLVCIAATGEELLQCLHQKNIPSEECYCKLITSSSVILAPANRAVLSN